MGMVVRTNTMAQNANRQLAMNNSAVGKSLEKLSSGFRINRAADDASGLAISEKMKAQIKGLEQASANSQDGISLIQTAEGATTEIHNMLNRMTELATKSANGTIQNDVDREAIQREVDDLNSEITRIAESTNFNGINLLDGNLSATGSGATGVPAIKGLSLTDHVATATTSETAAMNTLTSADGTFVTYSFVTSDGKKTDITLQAKGDKLIASDGTEHVGTTDGKATAAQQNAAVLAELAKTSLADKFTFAASGAKIEFTSKELGKDGTTVIMSGIPAAGGATVDAANSVTKGADAYQSIDMGVAGMEKKIFTVGGKKFAFAQEADVKGFASDVTVIETALGTPADAEIAKMVNQIEKQTGYKATINADGQTVEFKANTSTAQKGQGGLKLQVGDTNAAYNHVTVSVDNLSAKGIGTDGIDVSSQDAAGNSIQTIKDAINQVSTNRANLGSLQNRLEYTINNLDTTAENMTAANSRIRDTDMAKEMMNYTKMNILTQSAQAMLAQANQAPQAILQLLQ